MSPVKHRKLFVENVLIFIIILQGFLVAICALAVYRIGMNDSVDMVHTMVFATLAFSHMTLIFQHPQRKAFCIERNIFQ